MEQEKIIKIHESITVNELATALNVSVASLIGELFKNGIMATINQSLDYDTVAIIIEELKLDVKLEKVATTDVPTLKRHQLSDRATERPPIVAVMGHVDHGKTTLLDNILKTKVVDDEAGLITQYISAYQQTHGGRVITFLDTPGHEAFAAVRQHGAILTDIVIIVVAADDGVKPQTVEAINFARTANAKIIVAINKIDKPAADVNRAMTQLATDHHLTPEEWGGDVIMVPVSAKTGEGVDKLLETILLVADMEELKADHHTEAEGLVVEAKYEHGKGSVVNLLVQQGELKAGDFLVAGASFGKIRTLLDFQKQPIKKAGPSTPVIVTGIKQLPEFGELFKEVKTEREAKRLANQNRLDEAKNAASTNITGGDLLQMMKQKDEAANFNVIIKADVQGSLTSVIDSLKLIETEGKISLNIVSSGVGDISENDIQMAEGSNQVIIYGFNVGLPSSIRRIAATRQITVKIYDIIYELLDDAMLEMEKLLPPVVTENEVGKLKVKGVFKTAKESIIAGGLVTQGKIEAGLLVRIKRDKQELAEAEVTKVQKNQSEVKDVVEGEMCGLELKTTHKVQLEIDDQLEFFHREVTPGKLKH